MVQSGRPRRAAIVGFLKSSTDNSKLPAAPSNAIRRTVPGKLQYTGNLSLGDLPNAIRVLQLAQVHAESKEAEVFG